MELFHALGIGFSVALSPINIGLALGGALIGTLVGILPGLGVSTAMSLLLPVTFGMVPASSLILMAGVYCGARYGGSTTAILMNVPGESADSVTCLDGYQLTLKGRVGPALGISALSHFFGGTASVIGLMLLAPPLAQIALRFGPPEYFAMTVLGLCLVTSVSGKSIVKGLIAASLGMLIAMIGSDVISSVPRLTFGQLDLLDGVSFITVAVGLFAVSEILINLERHVKIKAYPVPKGLRALLPTRDDLRRCVRTWISSTFVGFFVGVLPGGGSTIAAFLSYGVARTLARNPEEFGKGAVEGLAAPDAAENASTGGSLVPMFTLGIPGSSSTAMMMAVLVIAGLHPGPTFINEHPDVFWGVVASMYLGNVILLLINLPLISLVVQLLRLPYHILYIVILIVCCLGVYSIQNSVFDLGLMIGFGLLGYTFKKLDYPPAAMLLAMILEPITERSLRQSLILSRGSFSIFLDHPFATGGLLVGVVVLFLPIIKSLLLRRAEASLAKAVSTPH